jgi:hypothetical protein
VPNREYRQPRRTGGIATWRQRRDGGINVGQALEVLERERQRREVPPPPTPPTNSGAWSTVDLQGRRILPEREAAKPAPDTPPRWGRGKARSVPRAGRVATAGAASELLAALGSPRARRMILRGGWWRWRAQAVVALAAALAIQGRTVEVLGVEPTGWWPRFCSLPADTVATIGLPPEARAAIERWLACRTASAPGWLTHQGSTLSSRGAIEKIAVAGAREAWRLVGQATRPAALLRLGASRQRAN